MSNSIYIMYNKATEAFIHYDIHDRSPQMLSSPDAHRIMGVDNFDICELRELSHNMQRSTSTNELHIKLYAFIKNEGLRNIIFAEWIDGGGYDYMNGFSIYDGENE